MPEDIKAHITGVVFQIVAHSGDAVSEGDPVIVLESMKMEIPVESPRAGVVKTIPVQEGQTVQEGEVVAILE
jgi:biotin carboxyl carrier protein